jgi:hypothetical protein
VRHVADCGFVSQKLRHARIRNSISTHRFPLMFGCFGLRGLGTIAGLCSWPADSKKSFFNNGAQFSKDK